MVRPRLSEFANDQNGRWSELAWLLRRYVAQTGGRGDPLVERMYEVVRDARDATGRLIEVERDVVDEDELRDSVRESMWWGE